MSRYLGSHMYSEFYKHINEWIEKPLLKMNDIDRNIRRLVYCVPLVHFMRHKNL